MIELRDFHKKWKKKKDFFKTISKNEKDFSFSILELFLKSLIFKDDIIENEKLILISEGVAHHHPHATIVNAVQDWTISFQHTLRRKCCDVLAKMGAKSYFV